MKLIASYPISIDILWDQMIEYEHGKGSGELDIYKTEKGHNEYQLSLTITTENGESCEKFASGYTLDQLVVAMAENSDYCSIEEHELWGGLNNIPEIQALINKEIETQNGHI